MSWWIAMYVVAGVVHMGTSWVSWQNTPPENRFNETFLSVLMIGAGLLWVGGAVVLMLVC